MSRLLPLVLVVALVTVAALALGNATAPAEKREHHRVRWAVYQQEHRVSTNLGRKVRALRRRMLVLRAQLRVARRVQARERSSAARVAAPPPASVDPPAHRTAWLCIHAHEGAWDANTGNGYYGGLQMDIGFQQAYGSDLLASKGTADHWSPLEQMQVAERAYQVRGFSPWPNTARMCGLT